jgi:hypothetical protein
MDIQGRVMAIELEPQGSFSIDVREYPAGIYVLMIRNQRVVAKFITVDLNVTSNATVVARRIYVSSYSYRSESTGLERAAFSV